MMKSKRLPKRESVESETDTVKEQVKEQTQEIQGYIYTGPTPPARNETYTPSPEAAPAPPDPVYSEGTGETTVGECPPPAGTSSIDWDTRLNP